jgi:hypothetical protein
LRIQLDEKLGEKVAGRLRRDGHDLTPAVHQQQLEAAPNLWYNLLMAWLYPIPETPPGVEVGVVAPRVTEGEFKKEAPMSHSKECREVMSESNKNRLHIAIVALFGVLHVLLALGHSWDSGRAKPGPLQVAPS